MRRTARLALPAAFLLLAPQPAQPQSLTSASLSGTLETTLGAPLQGALVTLGRAGGGGERETTTDASGRFAFALVAPGAYELRAEALGYRPVLARTLTLSGGERARVALVLEPALPPVLTVDTVALGGAVAARWRPGGTTLGSRDLDGLARRFPDASPLAHLAPGWDRSLGARGLPGALTLVVADGVPFYAAPHPRASADQVASPLFAGAAVGMLTALDHAADVELGGSAGGYLALGTRTEVGEGSFVAEGGWSGSPLWSSSRLDVSSPSLTSFEASARAALDVSPGSSRFVVTGDAFQQETPLAPRVSSTVAATLTGLDPNLVDRLVTSAIERLSSFSALARFDAARGGGGHVFVRGGAAYARREFRGAGPVTLAGGAALPEERIDYSFAGGILSEYRPGLVFEVRAGLSGSARVFDETESDRVSAALTGSGHVLGVLAGGPAESSRVDFVLLPLLQLDVAGGVLKVGTPLRASRHAITHRVRGEAFFSDGPALVAGRGFARALDGPQAEFSTREMGGFVQYAFEPAPGLELTLGGRIDYETVPAGEAALHTGWLRASGLRNDEYPSRFVQAGTRLAFSWDPTLEGTTELTGALGVHHGDVDPRALAELFARDGQATSSSFAGSGLSWPGTSLPPSATTLPTLSLLGPDTRPPRSVHASLGVLRRLLAGWSAHLGASYRRTDFLLRRRNLNLPVAPQAVDAYGRDVFGTLAKDGSLVSATGADARRFTAFHEVYALDPDGWSEYRGLTGGVEYSGTAAELFVAYTWSETTDNWIGAGDGAIGSDLPPLLPASEGPWSDAPSDFDARHRIAASASLSWSFATLGAAYRFRSGLPFTPGYRAGVDANGDGAYRNDVAFVDGAVVGPLLDKWPCLANQVASFADRNSCRGPVEHALDLRLELRVGRIAGRQASVRVDALDLLESQGGVIDDALLLVDPAGTIATGPGGVVTIPVVANPDFGRVLYPLTRGRMLRVGFRIGA